jgi:hypothetical protein
MNLSLPYSKDIVFWNLLYGGLIALLLNYALKVLGIVQEIDLMFILVLGLIIAYLMIEEVIPL